MKRIAAILAVFAAATAALGQTNQVLSRNAVGYETVSLPANTFQFVTMQFNNIDGSGLTVSNVLPVASNNTQCILWDQANQQYITLLRTKGAWTGGGTQSLTRGQAFFLKGAAVDQTFYFMGEVPDSITATQTVSIAVPGFSAMGSGYPVATYWTNTAISAALSNSDQFIVYDTSISNYTTFAKSKGAWAAASTYVIQPAQGFFVRKFSINTNTWTEVKPYTWP